MKSIALATGTVSVLLAFVPRTQGSQLRTDEGYTPAELALVSMMVDRAERTGAATAKSGRRAE